MGAILDLGPAGLLVPGTSIRLWPEEAAPGDEPWLRRPPRSLRPVPAIEDAFDTRPRPAIRSDVRRLERAHVVGGDGAVYDRRGRLVWESTSGRASVARKMALPRRARVLRGAVRTGRIAVLAAYRDENYYHWVTDVLTRLPALEETGAELVISASDPPWQRRFTDLLGVATRPVRLDARTHLAAEAVELAPFAGTKHPRSGVTFHPRATLARLAERLRAATGAEGSGRCLYVSRREASRRRIVGEAGLESLLHARGFETVVPGAMDVAEQVRVFAAAEAVVSPHGAALANLAFVPPGATIVELLPPDDRNPVYYALADTVGHDYWYVPGDEAPAGHGPLDFGVDLRLLEATLDAAGL